MKKILTLAVAALVSFSAFAQGPVTKYLERRFGGDDKSAVYVEKGRKSIGIKGGFRSFTASGDETTNAGYALLSLLNVGNGQVKVWNVAPRFSYFVADNLSVGVQLHYTGYSLDTDLNLDFRDILNSDNEALNVNISNRSMRHHTGGASLVMRRYVPLFGSKTFAVFGEGRLQGSYGITTSAPRDAKDVNRERMSHTYGISLNACGGLSYKLKDNTAITVSIPLFGVGYNHTVQNKTTVSREIDEATGNQIERKINSTAHLSEFSATRSLDFLGIQFGFARYL